MFKKQIFSKILLMFFLFLILNNAVLAIATNDLIIKPNNPNEKNPLSKSWFIYNLHPGNSKSDSLFIQNQSDKEKNLSIYALDSASTSSSTKGEFVLKKIDEVQNEIGDWILLESENITIEASEEKIINFSIKVPENISTREYSGAILVHDEDNPNNDLAIRVYQTVPGEITKEANIQALKLQYNKQEQNNQVLLTVINNGDSSLEIDTEITYSGSFFDKIEQKKEGKIMLGPNKESTTVFDLTNLQADKYNFQAKIFYTDIDGNLITIEHPGLISFWNFSDQLYIYSIAVGLIFIILIIIFILIKNNHKENMDTDETNEDNENNKDDSIYQSKSYLSEKNKFIILIFISSIIIIMAIVKLFFIFQTQNTPAEKVENISESINSQIKKSDAKIETREEKNINNELENISAKTLDQNQKDKSDTKQIPEKSEKTPENNLQKSTIKILNGNGTAGASTEIKEILEKANYKNIETDNADNFDYQVTQIKCGMNIDMNECFDVKKNISTQYKQILIEQNDLEKDKIIIILGKK